MDLRRIRDSRWSYVKAFRGEEDDMVDRRKRSTMSRWVLALPTGTALAAYVVSCAAVWTVCAANAVVSPRELKIRAILDVLVRERQKMKHTGTEPGLTEANRLSIVYWQWELSRCLGDEHARENTAT